MKKIIISIILVLLGLDAFAAVSASRIGYSPADGTVFPKYYRPLRVDSLVMKMDGTFDTITGFSDDFGLDINNYLTVVGMGGNVILVNYLSGRLP